MKPQSLSGSFSQFVSYGKKYLGLILFCVSLVIGFLTYHQYGMSWDDPMQRGTGQVNYDYMFHGDQGFWSGLIRIMALRMRFF